jgi:deazaflavin-dependent oxidoreductase (nitroreductase family)
MSNSSSDAYNASIIEEFRATAGRVGGPWKDTPLLLLHHVGAKSGRSRITPLGVLASGNRYVVVASNGGSSTNPDWYYNLKADPEVTIEAGTETIHVVASEATGSEREHLFQAIAAGAPKLREYQAKTKRLIPVIVLTSANSGPVRKESIA